MPNILRMGALEGSFIVSEATMWRSRDEVEVAIPAAGIESGTLLKAGAEAGDPLVPVAAAADTPVGVLLFSQARDEEGVAQTKKATVMVRDAELRGNGLVFFESATADQKVAMGAALASAGIVVRW